jgi:phosphatidylinositol alpha-1,6-mannosyltransferase
MRVLLLTPDFPPAPGGIQLLMSRLAANLRDAEVRVVTLAHEGLSPRAPEGVGVVSAGHQGSQNNKVSNLRLNAFGLAIGLRFRPDVVISGHAVTAPAAAALKAVTRARVIQYLHADEARQRPRLLSFAVRRADAVVAVSGHARGLALAAGCDGDRIRVIYPGVDAPEAVTGERSKRPTLVTVARMQMAYKGHDVIIRALPAIRADVPEVRWVVIGEGRLRPELEALAEELGVSEAIDFAGHLDDAERDRRLQAAHVFAMPSRLPPGGRGGEGFGIVFLEAGAHGLPVVAGSVGGALDAVSDGETGLLVDPTDEEAVANAIVRLLLDRDLADRLGTRGAERARELTWERHAEAVGELMREVAGG